MGKAWGKTRKTDLLDGVEQGESEGFCGNLLASRLSGEWRGWGFCGKAFRNPLADLGSLGRDPDLGRRLPAFGVGVLEHGQRALHAVLEDALQDVDLSLDVDEGGLELVHV